MKNFQFVSWYPEWIGFGIVRFSQPLSKIYKQSIRLGYWEIRRWARTDDNIEDEEDTQWLNTKL